MVGPPGGLVVPSGLLFGRRGYDSVFITIESCYEQKNYHCLDDVISSAFGVERKCTNLSTTRPRISK